MAKGRPTIFVQIAAYRDPECGASLADLFAQATYPERVRVGVCWQYKPGQDDAKPPVPAEYKKQVRIDAVEALASEGPSWAKARAQGFYTNEDYVLMIDSHMRFAKGWDESLISEWKACGDVKAVLSNYPPNYTPPRKLADPALTVVRAHPHTVGGDIRFRGEPLRKAPAKPLRGAFAAPGFMFSRGTLIGEVPYDPYLYFEQEEMCFSARLFTHGWNVYHPTQVMLYHLYDSTPVSFQRHKHWSDHVGWQSINARGRERRDHLLAVRFTENRGALAGIDDYGHGEARGLDEYEAYCGIEFASGKLSEKAVAFGFNPAIAKLLTHPVDANSLLSTPAANQNVKPEAVQPSGKTKLPSAFTDVPVSAFKPKTKKIFEDMPSFSFAASAKGAASIPKPVLDEKGVPPGVLLVRNFLPQHVCQHLIRYADKTAGRKLEVVDNERSTRDKIATKESSGRVTDHVPINAISGDLLPVFIDVYAKRLAPFYGVEFEWFERPQILRYSAGGKYDPHADAENMDSKTRQWSRSQDRDISVLLYLNDDYEGGELGFDHLGYEFKPEAGMLVAFPSDHRYLHAARPTRSGTRYVIVSWAAVLGTPRVQSAAPYASVFLSIRP